MQYLNFILTRIPFFIQLVIFLVIIAIIPLLSLSYWQYSTFEQAIVDTRTDRLWSLAQDKRQIIQHKTLANKHFLQQLGMSLEISSAIKQAKGKLLRDTLDANSLKKISALLINFRDMRQYDRVFLVDNKGQIVFSQQEDFELGKQLSAEKERHTALGRVYHKVVQQQSAVVEGYTWYEPFAKVVSFMAAPIVDTDGVQYGYLIAQNDKSWLLPIVEQTLGLGKTGEVLLGYAGVDGNPEPLIYPKYWDNARHGQQQKLMTGEQIALSQAMQGHEGIGTKLDYRASPVLSAWLYEPELNIGIMVKQDLAEVLLPVEEQLTQMKRMLLLVLFLVVLFGAWINYRLAKPIIHIANHVKELGNKSHLPPLPQNLAQSKELNILVTGVNQTATQIESQMNLLVAQADHIEAQAQKLQLTNYLLEQKVEERTKKLQTLSITDPMTGLYNRRHFNEQIDVRWKMAFQMQRCLALVMLDVDYFKRYNDSMGHHAGDTALIEVAKLLHTAATETQNLAFRLGGEEMAMLLLVDEPEQALQQAQEINQQLIDLAIPHPTSDAAPVLTASIGICYVDARNSQQPIPPDVDKLYLLADEALYQAKESGRNQSVLCLEGLR